MKLKLSEKSGITRIDRKDKKILEMLQHDARESRTQIAKKIGLSKDAVNYRIKNYESKGLIQGYRAVIDSTRLGYFAYHLFLQLKTPAKDVEDVIISNLRSNPYVRAILKFSGKYDLEVALIAKDIHEFDETLSRIISQHQPHLQSYDVVILSGTYISRTFPASFMKIGGPKDDVKGISKNKSSHSVVDSTDRKILSILSDNATATYYDISKSIGVSSDTVRYRIKRMEKDEETMREKE